MVRRMPRGALWVVLAVDAVALIAFYALLPALRRPCEIGAVLVLLLSGMTAAVARSTLVRNGLVALASLAAGLAMVEFSVKALDMAGFFQPVHIAGGSGNYPWRLGDAAGYFGARDRALRDGLAAETLADRFAGDPFAGVDASSLVRTTRTVGLCTTAHTEGRKRFYRTGTPLEYEHNPDNLVREWGRDAATDRPVFDVQYRIDAHGGRETREGEEEGRIWIFLGDSFTFGAFLNGDETTPHYFSEALGFRERVVNLGVMGWGPHHVLRELEGGRRVTDSVPPEARVGGVFFGLIDTHADRVVNPTPKYLSAPSYVPGPDGGVRLRSRRHPDGLRERVTDCLAKSRVYGLCGSWLETVVAGKGLPYRWRLTVGILAEMDRLCRARYGVPLTVVYWDETPGVMEALGTAGVDAVPVSDAFPEGDRWRDRAIQYLVWDGHPSAWANKLLARYLHERAVGKGS